MAVQIIDFILGFAVAWVLVPWLFARNKREILGRLHSDGIEKGRKIERDKMRAIIAKMQESAEANMMFREAEACERFMDQLDKLEV